MRFGAFVPQGWRLDLVGIPETDHWPTMLHVAKVIESAGFESAWVYDHFHTVPNPTQEVTYEAWTLMAALAAATDTVRLGQMCTCNSYRPPSYLAKVASSIDVISGGRLEMGIGAGWYEHEYRGFGYEFPKASVRIGMLREAVEIMLALWTEDEVTYEGKYYQLNGAINRPKGIQQPTIPLWVAGGGEKLTLNVAARYASYTNFGGDPDEFVHKTAILHAHCADVGRDPHEITLSSNFNFVIGEDERQVRDRLGDLTERYRPFVDPAKLDRIIESNTVGGTPEQIVAHLEEWKTAGCAYAIVYFPEAAYDTDGIELFSREVIPALA